MTTYFITRHSGAVQWALEEGLSVDRQDEHLEVETVQKGDTVIGTLPINLAARVCQRGARYLHLSLELPPELRGRELSASQMRRCNAHLQAYQIIPVPMETVYLLKSPADAEHLRKSTEQYGEGRVKERDPLDE